MDFIGYTYNYYTGRIWTIKFNYDKPIINNNIRIYINKFRIISIEDIDNNSYKCDKISNKIYGINSSHNFHKQPRRCFLNKNNIISHIIISDEEKYKKYTGEIMSYYSNGNIEMQFYMINGKIEGNFKSYMKNGEITEDSNFVNGKRHGIYKFIDYDYEYNYPDRTEKFIEINCVFNNGDLLEKNCVFNKKIVYKKLCLIINNKDNYDYYDKKTNRYTYYFNNFKIEWVYTNYNLDKYEMNFISENHFNDCLLYRTRDKPYYLTNRNDYTIL